MTRTRIMLYVNDVDAMTDFWQQTLGAARTATIELPENHHAVVLTVDDTTELALFSHAFIDQFSPEVANNQPSLMFFRTDFEVLHEQIAGATPIVDDAGVRAFGFPDPEGHYFAIGEANE